MQSEELRMALFVAKVPASSPRTGYRAQGLHVIWFGSGCEDCIRTGFRGVGFRIGFWLLELESRCDRTLH